MNKLDLIGRQSQLIEKDISAHADTIAVATTPSRFLVIGGAGSIGPAVTREIFKRNPRSMWSISRKIELSI